MTERKFLWLPARLYSRAQKRMVWRWLRSVLIYSDAQP